MEFLNKAHEQFFNTNSNGSNSKSAYIYVLGLSKVLINKFDKIEDWNWKNLDEFFKKENLEMREVCLLGMAISCRDPGYSILAFEKDSDRAYFLKICNVTSIAQYYPNDFKYILFALEMLKENYDPYKESVSPVVIHDNRNAGRKKKLTSADIETLKFMRFSGKTAQEIAEHFDVSRTTIHKYFKLIK